MSYLLDATALIEFAKGIEPTRSRVLDLLETGHTVALCGVTVAEFHSGIAHGQDPRMDRFIDRLPCWEISREVGRPV